MKLKTTFLTIFAICIQFAYAQDKVYQKSGKVIEVKAVEQTFSVLRYKMTDYAEGPVLWLPLNKIAKIEYQNGYIDYLTDLNPRMKRPLCISLNGIMLLDDEGFFPVVKAGYFITPQIEIEGSFCADFGGSFYVTAGPKLHICPSNSTKLITPFIGLLLGIDSGYSVFRVPFGVNYSGHKGLNISLSFNIQQYLSVETYNHSFLEAGVGYRF